MQAVTEVVREVKLSWPKVEDQQPERETSTSSGGGGAPKAVRVWLIMRRAVDVKIRWLWRAVLGAVCAFFRLANARHGADWTNRSPLPSGA